MDELYHLLLARAPGALDRLIDGQIKPVHRLVTLIIGAAGTPEGRRPGRCGSARPVCSRPG